MELQIQDLVSSIKKDGIESANREAAQILADAKAQAEKIVADARSEADKLRADAQAEIGVFKASAQLSAEQAKRDAVLAFRQEIGAELTKLLAQDTHKALDDKDLKIDAEEGEGITLAKKYGVRSYPTYAFVDPATEEIVHRSSSRQTPEQFIQTGKDANIPTKRSFYLQEQYTKGNRERAFLIDYINYHYSVYARNNVQAAFDELIKGGAKLTDPDVWEVYVNTINGMNPYLKQVSDNYADFCQRFGKKAVDAKLAKETSYGELAEIEALCNYEGKNFNLKMIRINNDIREQKYEAAATQIDAMIADTTVNQQELISRLKFIARLGYKAEELPEFWFNKCVGYLQYIAYNQTDRDDAFIHQEYAAALEMVLRKLNGKAPIPACLSTEPAYGKKVYNMRPDALKMKPKRKK